MSRWPDRDEAQKILDDWVSNNNLKKHAWAVEAAMRAYAPVYGGDPEKWGAVGLLHDFDYERYPDLKDHPFKGAQWLREHGYDEELADGVLAHAEHTGISRDTALKKTIYAVDEVTGMVFAVALTRPSRKLADVTLEAVQKKWKEKSFAAGVDRKMVERGAEELGVPLPDLISTVIRAMQGISDRLGL
jgi:putative nucleotidyltransferase with HDIG domain